MHIYSNVEIDGNLRRIKPLSTKAVKWLINNEDNFTEMLHNIVKKFPINRNRKLKRITQDDIADIDDNDIKQLIDDHTGSIYILHVSGTNKYKIGKSKDPLRRIKEIQTGSPDKIIIERIIKVKNMHKEERVIHQIFQRYRTVGEWFEINDKSILDKALKNYKVETIETMLKRNITI